MVKGPSFNCQVWTGFVLWQVKRLHPNFCHSGCTGWNQEPLWAAVHWLTRVWKDNSQNVYSVSEKNCTVNTSIKTLNIFERIEISLLCFHQTYNNISLWFYGWWKCFSPILNGKQRRILIFFLISREIMTLRNNPSQNGGRPKLTCQLSIFYRLLFGQGWRIHL